MKINYEDIHRLLIKKSTRYNELKKQISKNGIITLSKPKIDFFSFVVKTIISQLQLINIFMKTVIGIIIF